MKGCAINFSSKKSKYKDCVLRKCSPWKLIYSVLYVNPVGTRETGFHTSVHLCVHACAIKTNETHRDQGKTQLFDIKASVATAVMKREEECKCPVCFLFVFLNIILLH